MNPLTGFLRRLAYTIVAPALWIFACTIAPLGAWAYWLFKGKTPRWWDT